MLRCLLGCIKHTHTIMIICTYRGVQRIDSCPEQKLKGCNSTKEESDHTGKMLQKLPFFLQAMANHDISHHL